METLGGAQEPGQHGPPVNPWDRGSLGRVGPQPASVNTNNVAHEVVWMLGRVVEQATEWQILVCVMDCDVAAAFDQVSHHETTEATLAMGVPPVLIAAWIR